MATKIEQVEELWGQLENDAAKDEVVFLTALTILTGEADLTVATHVFRLAHRDGISAPEVADLDDDEE